jgi:hypothetical protein
MADHFDDACQFLDLASQQSGTVLVHCQVPPRARCNNSFCIAHSRNTTWRAIQAGVSRSASVVLCYLMRVYALPSSRLRMENKCQLTHPPTEQRVDAAPSTGACVADEGVRAAQRRLLRSTSCRRTAALWHLRTRRLPGLQKRLTVEGGLVWQPRVFRRPASNRSFRGDMLRTVPDERQLVAQAPVRLLAVFAPGSWQNERCRVDGQSPITASTRPRLRDKTP